MNDCSRRVNVRGTFKGENRKRMGGHFVDCVLRRSKLDSIKFKKLLHEKISNFYCLFYDDKCIGI